MRLLIPLLLLLFSCSSEKDVDIIDIKDTRDIIIFPSYKKDSVEVFIPYTFRLTNKAMNEARFSRFDYKPDNKHVEADLLVIENDTIHTMLSAKAKYISLKSSKDYTFYLKTFESKKNVDEKYWKQFPKEWGNYINVLKYKFNRVNVTKPDYANLKKKIENDSIAFTFEYGEYMIIKVCKLNEYKFKTITTDDLLAHPEKLSESVFKP